jgi:hypothetical protein
VTIDQLSFSRLDPALGASMVPMIDNPQLGVINIGVGLCLSLMGTFDYPPPHDGVKFISNHHKVEIFQVSRSTRLTLRILGFFLPRQPRWMRQGTQACPCPCRSLK